MTRPWEKHYLEVMGTVPPGIRTIFGMDEDFGNLFVQLRELIFRERSDGLPLVTKEIVLLTLDIASNNKKGALNHMRAARRAGMSQSQLLEVLLGSFLILGVSSLSNVGLELWESWDASEPSS